MCSMTACGAGEKEPVLSEDEIVEEITINFWHNNSKLQGYFEDCAKRYHSINSHITINVKCDEADSYIDDIYNESIRTNNSVDVFLLSSDNIQMAYLMGLLKENTEYKDIYTANNFGEAAIKASTYNNKLLGYPLTFETAFMVYNKKYIKKMNTFADITAFSDNFQHTEENDEVGQIIGWDVSEIELNYPLLGEYMQPGGENADDTTKTYLDDNKLIECINEYKKFYDSYGIERSTMTYESCLKQFTEGKLVSTIVRTNDLGAIVDSKINFGIEKVPDFNENLKTKALSTTFMLVVDPYTSHAKVAENVAKVFSYDYSDKLFELSKYPAARKGLNNQNPEFEELSNIYSKSALKARYIEIADYYLRMEIMLHQVWDEDLSVEEAYKQFKDYAATLSEKVTKSTK